MFGKSSKTEGPKKCSHPACFCMVPGGDKYCSDHCRDTKGMTELNCQCHHSACQHTPA
ncbi:hypothetical protein [Acidipila sp. EB88]|uniref:hypothetical protein n=1 Tax=Acidipila sp. EB88 TaxID=2305226 RepID=UPI0013154872|nr:hypothetical protein [Acidipila sp. EB88]